MKKITDEECVEFILALNSNRLNWDKEKIIKFTYALLMENIPELEFEVFTLKQKLRELIKVS